MTMTNWNVYLLIHCLHFENSLEQHFVNTQNVLAPKAYLKKSNIIDEHFFQISIGYWFLENDIIGFTDSTFITTFYISPSFICAHFLLNFLYLHDISIILTKLKTDMLSDQHITLTNIYYFNKYWNKYSMVVKHNGFITSYLKNFIN